MKTLAQFKLEEKISQIDLLQKNGRAFAKVNDKDLVVSKDCDLKKPLFIIPLTKVVEGQEPIVISNAYLMINADTTKVVGSI